MPSLLERFQKGWNAFLNRDQARTVYDSFGGYSYRPDRLRWHRGSERSIAGSIKTRIAIDVAATTIHHVKVDINGRFTETVKSGLDNVLNVEANLDQSGREFIQDIVESLLDEGAVAVVPIDTDTDPTEYSSYQIETMRVGRIKEWFPQYVRVEVYNERNGRREELDFRKDIACIIQNPLYSIMNEPNSTMQRLIRKLALLDSMDEQAGAGKLDLIIQLPYVIKSQARKDQAEKRRKDIEMQLSGSKYGIAYTDGTEKITQLNRPLENNLLNQIQYLTTQVYAQLGITEEVFNGTADEAAMLNYYNRTIEPILGAIATELTRKYLTKTARTQGHAIVYFKDPFKLVPVNQIAEIADKFTRNEIMSPNEIRAVIGMKPSEDPKADELRNRNLNESPDAAPAPKADNQLQN